MPAAAAAFAADPRVVYAHPDHVGEGVLVPDDPLLQCNAASCTRAGPRDPAWGLWQWAPWRIRTPAAWDRTGGEGVVVAIVDTSVNRDHLDMGALWTNPDEVADGTDGDGNGFVDDVRGWDFVSTFNHQVELTAPADNVLSLLGLTPNASLVHGGLFGTSIAAPHAAGVAALLWAWHAALTAAEVRAALCAGVRDLGAPGRDVHFGCGRVDALRTLEAVCAHDVCADGVFEPACGEQCDDGNAVADDCCSPACELTALGDAGPPDRRRRRREPARRLRRALSGPSIPAPARLRSRPAGRGRRHGDPRGACRIARAGRPSPHGFRRHTACSLLDMGGSPRSSVRPCAHSGRTTVLVAVLVAGLRGVDAAPAAASDAYLCYGARAARAARGAPALPHFEPRSGVTLLDRFRSAAADDRHAVDLLSAVALCVPAGAAGLGIGDPATHLEAYKLRQTRMQPPQPRFVPRQHAIVSPLGATTLHVNRASDLLVPTVVAPGTAGTPPLAPHAIDHFQCYRARALTRTSTHRLTVTDAYGERLYDVMQPSRLCVPANKNGEDPTAPAHPLRLVCHRVRLARTRPAQERITGTPVSTSNQLGTEALKLGAARELCLPATDAGAPPAPTVTSTSTPEVSRTTPPPAEPTATATPTSSPSPSPETSPSDALVRIMLRPPAIARLPGEVKHFWATGHFASGATRDLTAEVVWASSNPAVAVAPNDPADPNRMDLLAIGETLISATDPRSGRRTTDTDDDAVLRVTGPLQQIRVHPDRTRAFVGGYEQMTAVGDFARGTGPGTIARNLTQDVVWSTTPPGIAAADNAPGDRSRVVALAPGTAAVSATDPATGIRGVAWFVALGDLVAIDLHAAGSPREFARMRTGDIGRVYAIGRYVGGGDLHVTQKVVFASSEPAIIDTPNREGDRGLFEAAGGGTAAITATDPASGIVSPPFFHTIYGEVLALEIPARYLRPRKYRIGFFQRPFLSMTAIYSHGAAPLFDFVWEVAVDDPAIAEVQGNLVRGLQPGTVMAGVRDIASGTESAARIPISFYGDLERLVVTPETLALRAGGEDQLTAASDHGGGVQLTRTQEAWYTSSAPGVVAATNEFGRKSRIVAVAPGEALIAAEIVGEGGLVSSADSGDDALVQVVDDLTALTVTPAQAVTAVGRARQLTATGADAAGRTINLTQDVGWSTDDPAVAEAANPPGDRSRIVGVSPGPTTVRAVDPVSGLTSTAAGGDAILTVLGAIESIVLLPETVPLLPGATFHLTAVGLASDGSLNLTQELTFASDDPAVVAVTSTADDGSRIVAVAPGTARVTATDPVSGLVSTETVVTVADPP